MKNIILFFVLLCWNSQDTGKLKVIADLPKSLKEVSGTETIVGSKLIWMLNDGGNSPKIYGVSKKGNIKKVLKIDAKNNDWEELASDKEGNLYIGDFGNNDNKRKDLAILKVAHKDLMNSESVSVERIQFYYPNQKKFPPTKKQLFFDAESFFYFNNAFYIFTKSRVKNEYGKTSLYKIPATLGTHEAVFISEFNHCNALKCWITSADISNDGTNVVLLSHTSALVFSNFKGDDFFSGNLTEIPFKKYSQKEGICFKNETTLYITDEKAHGAGGNLYELALY
jgi:hypothetical protein